MFKALIHQLPLDTPVPLHVQIDPKNSLAPWQRVGTIVRTGSSVRVQLDDDARHVAPAWLACADGTCATGRVVTTVRFGVFQGSRGVAVIAEGPLTTDALSRARRMVGCRRARRSGMRGVGPRGLRSSWSWSTVDSEPEHQEECAHRRQARG